MRTHPPVVDAPVSPPALSVVLVTAGGFGNIRRTVRHLRAQTVQSRLELIVVASSEAAIVDRQPHETAGFQRVVVVPAGPIDNVDTSAAAGIRRATAPVVAIIEDHAYPEPEWAAALVEAHRDSHAAIGPAVLNANPSSLLSWTNMLLAYGRWGEDAPPGEIDDIARHNSSFKREALLAYGDDLERLLGREGGLLQDLRAKGHRLLLQPAARIAHVNPSRLVSTADLRFNAGRLYGASRAARNRWSMSKRLLYAAAGPLIPFVRFRRLRKDLFGAGQRRALVPRVYPALLLGLAFDGAGQMAGYLFGAGRSPDKLAVFEMDRLQHLTARDRQAIDEAGRGSAPASWRAVPDAPRFTIVVPTHERPAQLRNCLQGLARLNYPRDRIDVVVVDDGSGQPPEREVEEARQALRVDLVTQGNAGPGGARNTGVARASGEYVAFLGDDCEPAADWLHALASRLSRAPDCLVGGRIVNALPSNPYSSASNRLISYLYRHYNADPELARFLTPNNMAMRRSLFEEVGGFEPAMGATGEDRELCDRWLHRGHRIVHAPEAIVHHSHPLTMGSFWQQQVDYGRGTYRYRARQRQPRPGTLMPERLSFYINLVLFPFSQGAGARAWQEAWLLGVSQVATAAGFFGEALRTARSRQ